MDNIQQKNDVDPFDRWIDEAIAKMPSQFREEIKNVSIEIEDEPNENQDQSSMLLGLYHGVPNPYKGPHYTFTTPDKISLYRNNILAIAKFYERSIPEIIAEVLYHEIGHLLGMNEADLEQYKSF